jgi:DNA repair photolyase
MGGLKYKAKPTRQECGCTQSSDIGAYDTCPHGCVYCYANMHKRRACKAFDNHNKDSAFLGLVRK